MAGRMLIKRIASVPTAVSRIRPIIGMTTDTDNIPTPPIIESPKAPLCGKFSAMNASVVGQKKVMPTAKTAAATKTKGPDALASKCRPANENIAENQSIPTVPILLEIDPAIARPKIMMPLIKARTRSAFTPVAPNSDSMRCVGPNSVAADNIMQTAMNK